MTGAETGKAWTENAAKAGPRAPLRTELWGARELIGFLAARDTKILYKQAALGVTWVLVQPVAAVAAFTLVFDHLADVGSQGIPYPLFALVGLVTWTYFSTAVTRASTVLVGNSSLITKVYFPRIAVPIAALLAPLVNLGISLLLVGLFMAAYGVAPGWTVVGLPIWLLMLLLTAVGMSLWWSALNVRFRDVQQAVGPILQLWLFVSPVAYPPDLLTGWQRLVYAVNPMSGVIDLGRWSLLGAPWPGWPLAVSAVTAVLVLAGGLHYFRRAERSFADVI